MARRREDLATVHLHQHPAIRLPVVDGPHPEYDTLQSLEACGIGERGAPLASPCLCRDPGTSFHCRIVCLREGCVDLMGPCWRKILSFVIDPCGGPRGSVRGVVHGREVAAYRLDDRDLEQEPGWISISQLRFLAGDSASRELSRGTRASTDPLPDLLVWETRRGDRR